MLKEYKHYIESIRNNLIQNDVNLEYIPLDSYRDLFMYVFALEQVIEFYEILSISESEYKINSKYIHDETREEKINSISNKEYQQFLKGYKKISAVYTRLEELRKKVGNLENISKEEKEFLENSVLDADNMVSLYQSQEGSEVVYVSHGIYIDEYVQQEDEDCERKEDNIYDIEDEEEEKEYRSHGIYIDEVDEVDEEEKSSEEVPHGVYLEDITVEGDLDALDELEDNISSEEDSFEDVEDYGIEYSESESDEDGLIYEEDEEGIVEDNEEYDDTDDGLVYEDKEEPTWDDEEAYEDDSQYQDEDDGIEYMDDEESNAWSEEEVEEDDGIEYAEDEDDGLIYDADFEDGLEEPEELEEDQEDVGSWLDEDVDIGNKPITSTPDMVGVNSVNRQSSSKAVSEERDISDKLQDVTNKLINQGISMVKSYFK